MMIESTSALGGSVGNPLSGTCGNILIEVPGNIGIVVEAMFRNYAIGVLVAFVFCLPTNGEPVDADLQLAQPVKVSNPTPDTEIRDRIAGIFS